MTSTPLSIQEQLQSLAPSAIIELFQIELTQELNGTDETLFFHAGTNDLHSDIVFQGNTYSAVPCEVEGFSVTTEGVLPRPTFHVANVNSAITLIITLFEPLHAKFTRIRTCAKFLDAVNFSSGNATADSNAVFNSDGAGNSNDIWYIDRVTVENHELVSFSLISKLDLTNLRLPTRQILEFCPWEYKGTQCAYRGQHGFYDINDGPTSAANDVCGKSYNSCIIRHPSGDIPFGGMPGCRLKM